ncbi:uncharacterized protein [Mytilus edulis]|uniref:uncharacterized protein n=1 Tax=Mytilus edulis TaxID=6550 RepID=UPI0039F1137D
MEKLPITRERHGIFSSFVNWIISSWNPYSQKDLQRMLERKIQNGQIGIHASLQISDPSSVCDEMELLLETILQQSTVPETDKGDNRIQNPDRMGYQLSKLDRGDNLIFETVRENTITNTVSVSEMEMDSLSQEIILAELDRGDNCFVHIDSNKEDLIENKQISNGSNLELINADVISKPNQNMDAEHCKNMKTSCLLNPEQATTECMKDVSDGDSDSLGVHKDSDTMVGTNEIITKPLNQTQKQEGNEVNNFSFNENSSAKDISKATGSSIMNNPVSILKSEGSLSKNTKVGEIKKVVQVDDKQDQEDCTARTNTGNMNSKSDLDHKSKENTDLETTLNDVEFTCYNDDQKNETESGNSVHKMKSKTKSVTWGQRLKCDNRTKYAVETVDSEASMTNLPSTSTYNPDNPYGESSSEETLTENDLAYGNEGFAQYQLFIAIEKKVEIEEINDKMERLRQLHRWKMDKIRNIVDIARAYYVNPTGRVVEEWNDLKRGMKIEKQAKSLTHVKLKMSKLPEFIPFFTLFITLAQFVTCGVFCYLGGLYSLGIEPKVEWRDGIQTFLGAETVHKWVIPNLWIGPSDVYITSVGAFFAPCLRDDIELQIKTLEQNYSTTETLGCCEMASRNTAATTTQTECQHLTDDVGIWKAGIKCSERPSGQNSVSHNLKPCCYNLRGQCKLTTHTHCVFLGGYFSKHSAEHCSQVNCINSICGMGGISSNSDKPWLPDNPAQWWRLPLSIVYHHGIIHVVIIGAIHFLIMRTMERSIGWLRIMVVYVLSGIGGILAASILEPYSPHVGATGSVCGLLGVTVVEILLLWRFINRPLLEISKVLFVIVLFLMAGTLQYISNYTIITGLIIGLCSGVIVLPFVTFSKISHRSRVILIGFSVPLLVAIYFVLLYAFFKVQSVTDCYGCKVINCIPYTENMCRDDYEE